MSVQDRAEAKLTCAAPPAWYAKAMAVPRSIPAPGPGGPVEQITTASYQLESQRVSGIATSKVREGLLELRRCLRKWQKGKPATSQSPDPLP